MSLRAIVVKESPVEWEALIEPVYPLKREIASPPCGLAMTGRRRSILRRAQSPRGCRNPRWGNQVSSVYDRHARRGHHSGCMEKIMNKNLGRRTFLKLTGGAFGVSVLSYYFGVRNRIGPTPDTTGSLPDYSDDGAGFPVFRGPYLQK